jgi:uncharacterized protein (TIGR02449 family)
MTTELDALESKVNRLIEALKRLQAENDNLRDRLRVSETERLRLQESIKAARQRLEALLPHLPGTGTGGR